MQRKVKKITKKFIYTTKKVAKSVLGEMVESFLFLFWLATPSFKSKILYSCLGEDFSCSALSNHIHRLYRKNFIQRIRKGRNIFLSLKKSPQELIFNERERLRMKQVRKKWDKKWRLVIYDIPENRRDKRDKFRYFLKDLGFGKVQESCWISPYDFSSLIYEFAKKEKILSYICIYEGKFFAGKNINKLVEEIWQLEKINTKYREIIELCKKAIEKVETEELSQKECFKTYHELFSLFKEILLEDPFLPEEFLIKWPRKDLEKYFEKFSKIVAKEQIELNT